MLVLDILAKVAGRNVQMPHSAAQFQAQAFQMLHIYARPISLSARQESHSAIVAKQDSEGTSSEEQTVGSQPGQTSSSIKLIN